MTLDEAIKHAEEVMFENMEKTKCRNASDPIAINCFECAEEHRQLAEWLKELKGYREAKAKIESLPLAWEKVKAEIKEHTKRYSLSSEQNCLGTVLWSKYMISFDDVIAIIDKHLQEVTDA